MPAKNAAAIVMMTGIMTFIYSERFATPNEFTHTRRKKASAANRTTECLGIWATARAGDCSVQRLGY